MRLIICIQITFKKENFEILKPRLTDIDHFQFQHCICQSGRPETL
jgi:hypothetical protein